MIKPTVGRVVWFYGAQFPREEQPQAAIIAHVWSDRCVNIALFDCNGNAVKDPPTSVKLLQEGDVDDGGMCVCWMPYQIGQAKKNA